MKIRELFEDKNIFQGDIHKNDYQLKSLVDKHLKSKGRDVIACQRELIQAGLKEFAKL